MTEWIKYDPLSRAIESHVKHLVVNGNGPVIAVHAKLLDGPGYGWFGIGGYRINGVTHYAIITPVPKEGE